MPVEEVLVEHRVVVAQVLRQAGEAGGRDLLQGGLVRLVADASAVQDAPVLSVHPAGEEEGQEQVQKQVQEGPASAYHSLGCRHFRMRMRGCES